jgi:hypothetical protein
VIVSADRRTGAHAQARATPRRADRGMRSPPSDAPAAVEEHLRAGEPQTQTPITRAERGTARSTRRSPCTAPSTTSGRISAQPGRGSSMAAERAPTTRGPLTHEARAQRARADVDGQEERVAHRAIMNAGAVSFTPHERRHDRRHRHAARRGGIGVVRVSGGDSTR